MYRFLTFSALLLGLNSSAFASKDVGFTKEYLDEQAWEKGKAPDVYQKRIATHLTLERMFNQSSPEKEKSKELVKTERKIATLNKDMSDAIYGFAGQMKLEFSLNLENEKGSLFSSSLETQDTLFNAYFPKKVALKVERKKEDEKKPEPEKRVKKPKKGIAALQAKLNFGFGGPGNAPLNKKAPRKWKIVGEGDAPQAVPQNAVNIPRPQNLSGNGSPPLAPANGPNAGPPVPGAVGMPAMPGRGGLLAALQGFNKGNLNKTDKKGEKQRKVPEVKRKKAKGKPALKRNAVPAQKAPQFAMSADALKNALGKNKGRKTVKTGPDYSKMSEAELKEVIKTKQLPGGKKVNSLEIEKAKEALEQIRQVKPGKFKLRRRNVQPPKQNANPRAGAQQKKHPNINVRPKRRGFLPKPEQKKDARPSFASLMLTSNAGGDRQEKKPLKKAAAVAPLPKQPAPRPAPKPPENHNLYREGNLNGFAGGLADQAVGDLGASILLSKQDIDELSDHMGALVHGETLAPDDEEYGVTPLTEEEYKQLAERIKTDPEFRTWFRRIYWKPNQAWDFWNLDFGSIRDRLKEVPLEEKKKKNQRKIGKLKNQDTEGLSVFEIIRQGRGVEESGDPSEEEQRQREEKIRASLEKKKTREKKEAEAAKEKAKNSPPVPEYNPGAAFDAGAIGKLTGRRSALEDSVCGLESLMESINWDDLQASGDSSPGNEGGSDSLDDFWNKLKKEGIVKD